MIAIEQPHARWLNLLWSTVSMNRVYDVEYGELPIRKLDAYFPENNSFATTVYFHGGGLEAGDKADKNYVEIAECFAKNGYAFISVNYRMYPTAKFPRGG